MNKIFILSKRKKLETIYKQYPNAKIIDLTSKSDLPWIKFSPFYPHGNIPVIDSPEYFSQSVEGIWQGFKVFEREDIDLSKFNITNMKGIKRTIKRCGEIIGHRKGVNSREILGYQEARLKIYLPAYRFVLKNCLIDEIKDLKSKLNDSDLVFLDYETNADIYNLTKPLSHASLIARYLDN
ncbi:MAG: hypothetical protein QNJ38_09095 [Prochloraceae cyanobacterium]|nr:hypothetical protein [Prochloraceae cyanobacterium]